MKKHIHIFENASRLPSDKLPRCYCGKYLQPDGKVTNSKTGRTKLGFKVLKKVKCINTHNHNHKIFCARLTRENRELMDKIKALNNYLDLHHSKLTAESLSCIKQQLHFMLGYSATLLARIQQAKEDNVAFQPIDLQAEHDEYD